MGPRAARCFASFLSFLAVHGAVVAGPRERPVHPHARPSWELDFASPVRWQLVTHLGQLLVQTDKALHGVDPTIGKIAWTRSGLGPLDPSRCHEVPRTPLLICGELGSSSSVVVLETLGGTVVFDSRKLARARLVEFWPLPQADGLLVLTEPARDEAVDGAREANLTLHELARAEIRWRRAVPLPSSGESIADPLELAGSVLFASVDGLLRLDSRSGSTLWRVSAEVGEVGRFLTRGLDDPVFVWATEHRLGADAGSSTYSAHEVASGSPVWKQPSKIPGPLAPAFFTEHGLVVGSARESHSIQLIDLATGTPLWGEGGRGIPVPGAVTGHEMSAAGLVVTTGPADGDGYGYRLNVLDPATGAPRFQHFLGMHGRMRATELVADGILVVSTAGAAIVDTRSGAAAEDLRLPVEDALLAPAPAGGWFAFSPGEGALYRIEPQSTPTRISSGRVALGATASERWIEPYRDGVLVRSAQEIVAFGRAGELRYQVHYPAPEEPASVARLEQALRASSPPLSPEPVPARYRHLVAGRERAAAAEVRYVYMIVRFAPGRTALARVSKETGEILDRVDLEGRDWQLDVVSQRVFRLDGSRRLVAFGS